MSKLNHYVIGSILGSEIVGPVWVGHGQINSLGDARRISQLLTSAEASEDGDGGKRDKEKIVQAFLGLRRERGDQGSPDLYVADPQRNKLFIAACRELKLDAGAYRLNKTLMNARKASLLKGLKSKRVFSRYEDFAFACEFAGTELKYKRGATIDDIVCDPHLAEEFDAIARRLAPGHSSFEYRWGLLSIRKTGRAAKWKETYKMPKLTHRLTRDRVEDLPDTGGVYLLFEDVRQRPLYARSTEQLRRAIEQHRKPEFMSAIIDKLRLPDFDSVVISYAKVEKKLLKPVERRIVETTHPIFNVPRSAA